MNAEAIIGCNLDDVRALAKENIRVVESAPPLRPVRQNAPQKKKIQAAQPAREPRKEQRWGELRVLRCREIEGAGVGETVFEMTIAREEAPSDSFASALSALTELVSTEKLGAKPSSVV